MARRLPHGLSSHGAGNGTVRRPTAPPDEDEENRNSLNRTRSSMRGLRMELRKAVHFAQEHETRLHRATAAGEAEIMAKMDAQEGEEYDLSVVDTDPAFNDHDDDINGMRFEEAEEEDEEDFDIFELEQRVSRGLRMRAIPILSDEEEAFLMQSPDTPVHAAGRSAPFGYSPMHRPIYHKASSYSGGARTRIVPCSPPVPIPQTHWKRRNSMAGMSIRSSSMLIPSHDTQYSRTQCEARLWDEYWNYKLSLESRESFEASGTQRNDPNPQQHPTGINAVGPQKPRTDSEASTADTTREEDPSGSDDDDVHVFDMDDL